MKRTLLFICFTFCALFGKAQSVDVYIHDTDGPFSNVRNSPRGKVVDRIPVNASAMFSVEKPQNGWWRIVGDGYTCLGEGNEDSDFLDVDLKGSTTGYWIHYSVIAVGTRNYGGQHLPLRREPSKRAAVTYTLKEEQLVRPTDVKGTWVKVKTLDGKGEGWIEAEWLCGNALTNCC